MEMVTSHHIQTLQELGRGNLGVIPRNSAYYNLVLGWT